MEEEEESHTEVDEATEIAGDEVQAKGIPALERAEQLREDCEMLLAPVCLTTVRSWQQTKQDHRRRNS